MERKWGRPTTDFLGPHREICQCCSLTSAVGFTVPDTIWLAASGGRFRVLCLGCFTTMADEARLPWDKDIRFHPVSLVTFEEQEQEDDEEQNYQGPKRMSPGE